MIHLSEKQISELKNIKQEKFIKPQGLWYGKGKDWEKFVNKNLASKKLYL